MLLKIVTIFLAFIAVLAIFGRLRWPGAAGRLTRRKEGRLPRPGRCSACGAFRIGSGPCPCGKD